jgi:hypothetical protein
MSPSRESAKATTDRHNASVPANCIDSGVFVGTGHRIQLGLR